MENKISSHIKYLIIGWSILLSTIIWWFSFYMIEVQKSESIERQKEMETNIYKDKVQLEKQAYQAKRAKECLNFILDISKQWVNSIDWRYYDQQKDKCIVSYKNLKCKKDDLWCEKIFSREY